MIFVIMINIYNPDIEKYKNSAIDAIDSGWISNHGKYVNLACEKLKQITNSKYCILMSNGTCATHCLALALKFKHPNITKIYVPNNCYVAAWNAMLMEYDVSNIEVMIMDENTWNVNVDVDYIMSLESNSAMLIVHNLGNIINVPRLKRLRPDIIFIEDNCEGIFGKYENTYSGMSSDSLCSSCSFYGNKTITTGEGGAFFTQHKDVYEYINLVYSQGMGSEKYVHTIHAYNYRMTNIAAAFLYDQLNDLNNILTIKQHIFTNYNKIFSCLVTSGNLQFITHENNTTPATWMYAINIPNISLTKNIRDFFAHHNVDTRPFFYVINKHTHLQNIAHTDAVALKLQQKILMLPSSPTITLNEQMYIGNIMCKYLLYLMDIEIILINNDNKYDIYTNTLSKINNNNFRYFENRNITCFDNHKVSFILQNNNKNFVGYCHIDYKDRYWFGIYIDTNYRHKGIGNVLMNYLFTYENIYDIDDIYLTVDIENTSAISLYEKHNFSIIENNSSYYTMCKSRKIF